jgi:pyridinium-3,5-biscarboxylic acid mononucleotide sulfurtransferase
MTNNPSTPDTKTKLNKLKSILSELGSILVAFSGGVDSSFLLKIAFDTLPSGKVAAVTATSPLRHPRELEDAERLAEALGVEHIIIETDELNNKEFAQNPPDRCFICKKMVFSELLELAQACELNVVVDGSNASDLGDYRPGMKACLELGIRSPLLEAGLTKKEIRQLSREFGLESWDRPASPCLATRFPYGTHITADQIETVRDAEDFLRELGFGELRVRAHGSVARVELSREDKELLMGEELARLVAHRFQELGFAYTALDILGYRSGNMNKTLEQEE